MGLTEGLLVPQQQLYRIEPMNHTQTWLLPFGRDRKGLGVLWPNPSLWSGLGSP